MAVLIKISELNFTDEVIIKITEDCDIDIDIAQPISVNIINEATNDSVVNIRGDITTQVVLTLSNLSRADLNLNMRINLILKEASIKIINASLCLANLKYNYQIKHLAKSTYSNINNYAIITQNGNYTCDVSSEIPHGYSNSEAFQVSRVLTTGSLENIQVTPLLLMAEDKVKAKHACTIGRLDELQLFYMQLRGLSEQEIIKLMALSYLSNVLNEIHDDNIKNELNSTIIRQVDQLCLM
ncbi:MAG: SufD family Fe-S cluster assembly protein [Erysipelotrichaceae bacterium]